MLNFYPSGVPHITGHWCIAPITLLKASVFRACYRTGQCLPLCSSGLFNSQVSLETLLEFQSKVPKKRAVSIFLLQSMPNLRLEADASTKYILCSSFNVRLCIVGSYELSLNCFICPDLKTLTRWQDARVEQAGNWSSWVQRNQCKYSHDSYRKIQARWDNHRSLTQARWTLKLIRWLEPLIDRLLQISVDEDCTASLFLTVM